MTALLTSNPIKIVLDAFQDYFASAPAKMFVHPFNRILIAFAVITAVFTVTQRHDIPASCSRVIRTWVTNRYPMIGSQCMPKAWRATTSRTSTTKVFNRLKPIIFCKSGWKSSLTSTSSLIVCFNQFGMILLAFTLILSLPLYINVIVFSFFIGSSSPLFLFILVFFTPLFCSLLSCFGMRIAIYSRFVALIGGINFILFQNCVVALPFPLNYSFAICFSIINPAFLHSGAIIRVVPTIAFTRLFSVLFMVKIIPDAITVTASAVQFVSVSVKPKELSCLRILTSTLGTKCGRTGQIQHSVSLSLSHKWVSADGVSNRFSGLDSLADYPNYIMGTA